MSLAERLLAGDIRALARVLSLIENHSREAAELLRQIHPHAGRARFIARRG